MSAVSQFPWTVGDQDAELSPLFADAPVGIAQCQRQGYITALNPALLRMLGGDPGKLRSYRLTELVHPRDRTGTERLLRELFDGKRETFQVESAPIAAGGQPLRWTAWKVKAGAGQAEYVLALVESANGNARADEQVRHAHSLETMGRLAGGVAHDFNNLLTGVLLYCDLLMASVEPGQRVYKYAQEIRNAGMQATGLVRQLLSVARPAKFEPRLLSLNEIAEGMRNLLLRLIGENIELQLRLDPNLGLIKMDPTLAQQILLNLVLNARDAMPSGGRITIETANGKIQVLPNPGLAKTMAELPCAVFVVEDNGSGMDENTRAHVFESFFTTKGSKGTGLGLTTVHEIVTSSGGLIHVESAVGSGTRFTVLLPLAYEAEPGSNQLTAERTEGEFPAIQKEQLS